jgi:hypothetical protein
MTVRGECRRGGGGDEIEGVVWWWKQAPLELRPGEYTPRRPCSELACLNVWSIGRGRAFCKGEAHSCMVLNMSCKWRFE